MNNMTNKKVEELTNNGGLDIVGYVLENPITGNLTTVHLGRVVWLTKEQQDAILAIINTG